MLLPNEQLLDVLLFQDYSTLLSATFVDARFLGVTTKFAAALACRRSFLVHFFTTDILCYDVTIGPQCKRVCYKPGNRASLAAACREVAAVIGAHAVSELRFFHNTWNMPSVCVIFEALPSLKYAEDVDLWCPPDCSNIRKSCDTFMHSFAGMKSLHLSLNYDGFRKFSWTFLRQESARRLRLIQVTATRICHLAETMHRSVEELVRTCVTLPNLLVGGPMELDFSKTWFSCEFGLRIIELLKDSGRELTFRMRTCDDELVLDATEYTVEVDDATTRYTCEESGIVVEVKGRLMTVHSTAGVPRKKARNE